jgi:FlaG/FlaF family flagellin (archaellin)
MKAIAALHLFLTVTLPSKVAGARSDSERGSDVIAVAVIAAIVLGLAIAVGAAITSAVTSYSSQIHG